MSELKKLEALLSQGAITRRDFLARASALGATAAIAPSLLIGEAQAATPKKGGHFKVGIGAGSTTDSLDPGTSTNTYSQFGIMTMHNHLTEVDSDGNAVPDLAEMIDASPDARVWTVQLRKGVTFHNGKELDAADVIAS
ncbi:MAG: ABC transporter substrate-binding protein, partial [Gammaproteobacteria bacterium]|nr:ABC transporter substrate-binding protein [Gammaproteobacteria bacterium]